MFIQSPNFTKGRKKTIKGIVLHTIVGTDSSAIAWFKNPASQVSAHYVIGNDGSVTQMVKDEDTAWHAGRTSNNTTIFSGNPNDETIGIEHDDGGDPNSIRSDALYNASQSLVRDLCTKHGIPMDREHIVGHREIYGVKSCPGSLDIDRIIKPVVIPTEEEYMDSNQAHELIVSTLRTARQSLLGHVDNVGVEADAKLVEVKLAEGNIYELGEVVKRYKESDEANQIKQKECEIRVKESVEKTVEETTKTNQEIVSAMNNTVRDLQIERDTLNARNADLQTELAKKPKTVVELKEVEVDKPHTTAEYLALLVLSIKKSLRKGK